MSRRVRAFSLVELVIVVVVIGVIAAIAAPRLSRAASNARQQAFARQLRAFSDAIRLYYAEHPEAEVLADSTTGEPPRELVPYLDLNAWEEPTPLGGYWDHDNENLPFAAGVGVVYEYEEPSEALPAVDRAIDDGNLSTGSFQRITDTSEGIRFYLDASP